MAYTQITTDLRDHVLTITLNRPDKLNAWTTTMAQELLQALDQADADDDVRAVIFTGAGKAFCAGAELNTDGDTFKAGAGEDTFFPGENGGPPRDSGGVVSLRIYALNKPVIAAINGAAVGVGATMTLPMDIRIGADDAKLGFVFTRRGIVPEACSSWFLPRIVGIGQALEWVITGRVFSAKEALEGRLLNAIHPRDQVLEKARALAKEIVDNTAPVSVALARQLLWRNLGAEHPMLAHSADSRAMLSRGSSDDVKEGISSFLEKRPAAFPDRVSAGLPELFEHRPEPDYR
ncbi:MAG: crotonase/enoyl-CoA hydratase family protein [Solirubrobacterales bacterium]|nr:crotonase/enoyl-CoA hydratase family protein [Solirubrobacterales bacterium]